MRKPNKSNSNEGTSSYYGNPRLAPLTKEHDRDPILFKKYVCPRFKDLAELYPTRESFLDAFDRYQEYYGEGEWAYECKAASALRELSSYGRDIDAWFAEFKKQLEQSPPDDFHR